MRVIGRAIPLNVCRYIWDLGLEYVAFEIKVLSRLFCSRPCQAKSGNGTSDGCPASTAAEMPPHRDAHRADESPYFLLSARKRVETAKLLTARRDCRAASARRQLLPPARETTHGRNGSPRRSGRPTPLPGRLGRRSHLREGPWTSPTLCRQVQRHLHFSTCSPALGDFLAFTVENSRADGSPTRRDATKKLGRTTGSLSGSIRRRDLRVLAFSRRTARRRSPIYSKHHKRRNSQCRRHSP